MRRRTDACVSLTGHVGERDFTSRPKNASIAQSAALVGPEIL
jgi:hypothetical protein